ncbi:MAG TPA: ABC transporter permease [Gammaproteobacteria bacterium]|nr:ABC transporter permease [Gammaproteobacteria bacterium]
MLGIIIGVMAVIAVVSLIQGFSNSITGIFSGMGANSLTIHSYLPRKDRLAGKTAKVTTDDLLAIQHDVNGISGISPILFLGRFGSTVKYRNQSINSIIRGTTPSYALNNGQYPDSGRFITPDDDLHHHHVAVVGVSVIKKLHMPGDPIGQYIQMFNQWFKVVGVLHPLGQILGFDQDTRVLIPYGTARSLLGASIVPDIVIQLNVNNMNEMDAVTARIRQVLRRRHNLKPGQDDDFKIQTPEQLLGTITSILNSITIILGGIVAISLLVGGIGIMNIMLVSVTERTREIGIYKSLGARRSDILLQFLIEAVVLALIGGVIGLLLGYGIGMLVAHLVPAFRGSFVPWWAVVLAFGFSGGVGVIFGIAPAAKAAALDPIEALRYE